MQPCIWNLSKDQDVVNFLQSGGWFKKMSNSIQMNIINGSPFFIIMPEVVVASYSLQFQAVLPIEKWIIFPKLWWTDTTLTDRNSSWVWQRARATRSSASTARHQRLSYLEKIIVIQSQIKYIASCFALSCPWLVEARHYRPQPVHTPSAKNHTEFFRH